MGVLSMLQSLFKRDVVVSFRALKVVYDGLDHTPGYDVAGLPKGYTVQVNVPSFRDAGPSPTMVDRAACRVLNRSGRDVSRRFNVSFKPTLVAVVPAGLHVQTSSATKVYDGRPLCAPNVSVDGLVAGEKLAVSTGPFPVNAGRHTNRAEIDWDHSTARQGNYDLQVSEGVLAIGRRPLTVTAGSAEKVYDGTPLVCNDVAVDGLVEGEELLVRCVGRAVDEGVVTNHPAIDWGGSTASPGNYDVALVDGHLTVAKRRFDVQGVPATRCVFDGGEHLPRVDVPDGLTVTFEAGAPRRDVGEHRVGFVVGGPHYEDTRGVALLIIEAAPLQVRVVGGQFVYDGEEHRATVEVAGLPEGYRVSEASSDAVVRDVSDGCVAARCDRLVVVGPDGEDVTCCFRVEEEDAELEVVPAPLSVVTYDAEKHYDGTRLTGKGRVRGQKNGETLTLRMTGSQLEPGRSVNTYELVFDGTAREGNYRVAESLGRLTVLPVALNSERGPDGRAQGTSGVRAVAKARDAAFPEPVGRATPERREAVGAGWTARGRRVYRPRPIDGRPDLEEQGLGKGFRPNDEDPGPLPKKGFVSKLRDFEIRAQREIAALNKRSGGGLLFQCFAPFSTEFDELRAAFGELFAHYAHDTECALAQIHKSFQCAFLIYVADLARIHCGKIGSQRRDTLWDNLFKAIGFAGQSVKNQFKKMFISYLYRRGMPVYDANERHTYMRDTALLHCGLTVESWRSLWGGSFLPMARDAQDGRGGLHLDLTPEEVARHVLSGGGYGPDSRTLEVLERAPRDAFVSLCATAWKVAVQVERQGPGRDTVSIVNHGLPNAATRALEEVLAKREGGRGPAKRAVFIDRVGFVLDAAAGCARISWNAMRFPSSLGGQKVDFYVNGLPRHSEELARRVDGYLLQGGHIDVAPCGSYDVEVRIVIEPGPDGRDAGPQGACDPFFQSFQNSKPGCYEFVYDEAEGVYRYREPDERLRVASRIAYLLDKGLRVEPGPGMKFLHSYEARADWEGMSVFEFEVSPGASGAIVDAGTGEELSAWREDYRVRIEKDKVIGRTAAGLDLYGTMGRGPTNVALPSILVEAFEGADAARDLAATFLCDGREVGLVVERDDPEDGGSAVLRLSFPTSGDAVVMADRCELVVRQRTSGRTVMRYRFAVVPLRGFRLVDGKGLSHKSRAIYEFCAAEDMEVSDAEGGSQHVCKGGLYHFERLLSDEYARLRVSTGSRSIDVDLALAGVTLTVPERLFELERSGPLCLGTYRSSLTLADGVVSVSATCPRRNRSVMLGLGGRVLLCKQIERASDARVNIFSDLGAFRPVSGKEGSVVRDMPLVLTVAYGYEAKGDRLVPSLADIPVLACRQGLGFDKVEVRQKTQGGCSLRFATGDGRAAAVACDVEVTVRDEGDRDEALCRARVPRGGDGFDLPPEAFEAYERRRRLRVEVGPVDLFGGVCNEDVLVYLIKRGE